MANVEQPAPSQLSFNSSFDEPAKIQIENRLKILKNFIASNAQVYKFQNFKGEELMRVIRLCDLMGFGYETTGRKADISILYVYKKEGEISNQIQEVMSRKRKNCEEPESSQKKKSVVVDELNKIWVSQVLEIFLASSDEAYSFENKLSGKERRLVFEFCQKKGFIYTFSWHGIKQIVSIHKTKKVVDSTTLLESLSHVAVSKESDQVDMLKKSNKEEELVPPQHQDFIVIDPESKGLQFDLILQNPPQHQDFIVIDPESKRLQFDLILQNFLSSKDEVYNFEHGLSLTERELVHQLSQEMGLSCTFYGLGDTCKAFVYKTKKGVDTTMVLESLPHVTFFEESNQNKEEPMPPDHQNSVVDESTRIRISQTLENVLASKDKVDSFEAKLSPEECVAVHDLSPEMRSGVGSSGSGIKQTVSVQEIKKVGTITELKNLPPFTFSEKSKQALGGLLMHYPPGNEDSEQKEDDFFGRPDMSKADITKQLEDLDARMNTSNLKPITYRRSMFPIASFKDVITSTIESHQAVIICGDTGCGKTTQVPRYILDHMWGKGEVCKIVCTQPRHISATTVSQKISQERGENIGNNVGYKTHLESRGGRRSSIVLCTTRILLKALVSKGSWRLKTRSMKDDISSITHIIMDEIHERDQYSDLLLAIFREMLPSNPQLRLILMSSTSDPARFSQYFGDCPVIHVPGFTYQVKTYYLEDILSIVKSGGVNNCDNNHELSQEHKLSLDIAINLAWFNDEWCPLLELVRSKGSPKVFNYQHSLTGLNPLMVFGGKGKVSDMCMLLSLGANCHLRAKDGTTALEIAEKQKQQVAAELLKKHMDNDFSNKEGTNLLDKYVATVNPTLVDVFLIEQLIRKICIDSKDGSILVFLPGQEEINRTRERLLASPFFNDTSKFRVISLHSMVPHIEQNKVFMCPPPGCRKVVLSTNIAETAFAIDDIVFVIDTGRVKENIYPYNNVSTVQSSWVSKASAKQREGCAGHSQPGICYHLYSKVQADSLPDFQLPEIKRMPIEELCLLVKLFNPSCKIEEFLNRTLDPPGFESIQKGIAVLQKIGALSFDENLTQLGEKLGSLPVHPSTSRMLLFSILMNCLDPALTLACASEFEDPFMVPILPNEKDRVAAARSELASLYGGCGDQIALVAAFECWQNSQKMCLEAQFCSRYFVSKSSMRMLLCMRKKLATELIQNGLIHGNVQKYSLNAHDPGILHAVLVAGMYPVVGKACLLNESRKKVIVETESFDEVFLDSRSTNFQLSSQKSFDSCLVVYDEITRDDWGHMSIRNCTFVGLLPLLLLCTEIVVASAKDCNGGDKFMSSPNDVVKVIIDRWLEFESTTALDVSHLNYLRAQLSAAFLYKVNTSDVLPPILGAAMDTLACILSCDGLSGIPQTFEGADKSTTIVKASNLGKSAKRARLICENREGSQTELINQGASKAIKNPGGEISQNTPTRRGFKKVAVGWTFPEVGWIKANVDGSIQNFHATCGGVFRDATGSWCFGFALNFGSRRNAHRLRNYTGKAELYGILTALQLAKEKGISQLWIECDSSTVVSSIFSKRDLWRKSDSSAAMNSLSDKRESCIWNFHTKAVIRSIARLMSGNITVRISHCFREANKVADWLASTYAHTTKVGLHVLDAPPPECVMLLTEDAAGVYQLRSVRDA